MNKKSLCVLSFLMLNLFLSTILYADKIKTAKNLIYKAGSTNEKHQLDIYYPANTKKVRDVVFFIHGGGWSSGKKDTYWFLGRNFAKKGIVFVAINYRVGGENSYQNMAEDCVKALNYINLNVNKFGGNPSRIFLSGHSAGAHLAALIAMSPEFNQTENPMAKGIILNDPFGLDLLDYFTNTPTTITAQYKPPFGENKEVWINAAPITYVSKNEIPILVFNGSKTYPAILRDSDLFVKELKREKKNHNFIMIKGKKHVGMMSQMVWRNSKMYTYYLDFMKSN